MDYNVIYSYSRADAIEDGLLIDVTDLSKQAGIKYPVAISEGIWLRLIECQGNDAEDRQENRLLNLMSELAKAIRSAGDCDRVEFKALHLGHGQATIPVYALCHPGDLEEPVITVMLEGED
jgi:hypothetical protein